MANEIVFQIRTNLTNGNLTDSYASGSLKGDQSTTALLVRNTQSITTSAAQLELGSVVTPGMAVFSNLSETTTDYVEIGNYTGGVFYPLIKVKYGEQALCRISILATQLYAKSNNAAGVLLFYIIYND